MGTGATANDTILPLLTQIVPIVVPICYSIITIVGLVGNVLVSLTLPPSHA